MQRAFGFWQNKKKLLSFSFVSLRALSCKMWDLTRCGMFDPAKHLSTGLTFTQIGCKHVFRVKHMIRYFDESSQSVPRFQPGGQRKQAVKSFQGQTNLK